MRIPRVSRRIMFASVLGSALLAAGAPAFASAVPGYSGFTDVGLLTSGWQEKNGGAVNQSGMQADLYIPLAVNAGSHTVTVATYNPGGGTFYCTAYASDPYNNFTTGTTGYPATGNTTFDLSVTVPANGTMFVYCNVNANGTVWSVNYGEG